MYPRIVRYVAKISFLTALLFGVLYFHDRKIFVSKNCLSLPPLADVEEFSGIFSSVSQEDLMKSNSKTKSHPPAYVDSEFLKGGCPLTKSRAVQYKLMKWWINFSAQHKVTWFLTFGTLLGAVRHKDVVPWDAAADVGVMQQDVTLLMQLQTSRKKFNDNKISLICRPRGFCPHKTHSRMKSCNGTKVKKSVDVCSFCAPVCRAFYKDTHLNLWLYSLEISPNKNKLTVYDEGSSMERNSKVFREVDSIFPLKKCSMMGLTLPCPRKAKQYLNDVYYTWLSKFKCKNTRWVEKGFTMF